MKNKTFSLLIGIMLLLAFAPFISSAWTSDLNDRIDSFWKFNETNIAVGGYDDSLNRNTFAPSNIVSVCNSSVGIINFSVGFNASSCDGILNRSSLSYLPVYNGTSWTINHWVFLNTTGSNIHMLGIQDLDDSDRIQSWVDGSTFRLRTDSYSGGDLNTGITASTGQWYMITYTYNYTNLNLSAYVNGTYITSRASSQSSAGLGNYLGFGKNPGGSFRMDGMLDEVGIWNRSLSSAEVSQLWNGGAGITYIALNTLNVTLQNPIQSQNLTSLTNNFTFLFTWSSSDYGAGTNGTLLGNWSGVWAYNESNSTVKNNTQTNFTLTLPQGIFKWNVEANQSVFVGTNQSINNYTFVIDLGTITPQFGSGMDSNASYIKKPYIFVNISTTEPNPYNISTVLYNLTGLNQTNTSLMMLNYSANNTNINFTGLKDSNYTFNSTLYDWVGGLSVSDTRYLIVDTIAPEVNYSNSSYANGSILNQSYIYINTSLLEINPFNQTFFLYNSTSLVNSTTYLITSNATNMSINWTGLTSGTYRVNVTSYDAAGNINSTLTKYLILENTVPVITITSPTNTTYTDSSLWFNATSNRSVDYWILNYNGTNISITNSSGTSLNQMFTVSNGFYNLILCGNNSATGELGCNSSVFFRMNVSGSPPAVLSNFSNISMGFNEVNITLFQNYFNITLGSATDYVNVTIRNFDPPLTQSLIPSYMSYSSNNTKYFLGSYFYAINEQTNFTVGSYDLNRSIIVNTIACNSFGCTQGNEYWIIISSDETETVNAVVLASNWLEGVFPESNEVSVFQKFGIIFITVLVITLVSFLCLYTYKDMENATRGYIVIVLDAIAMIYFVTINYLNIWLFIGIIAVIIAIYYGARKT